LRQDADVQKFIDLSLPSGKVVMQTGRRSSCLNLNFWIYHGGASVIGDELFNA